MKPEHKADLKLVTALLILALMGLGAFMSGVWTEAPAGEEDVGAVTAAIFGRFVFAFELLSALLLAGLVGAVVVALREKEGA